MKLAPVFIKNKIRKILYGAESFGVHYSQSGEDINARAVLISFFRKRKGFYLDVGSFHPYIGSNTALFYRMGWRGINIDPRPGSKQLFDRERPDDINLEVGIGAKSDTLKYYFIADDSAMNSFSKQTLIDNGVLDEVKKVIDIPVVALQEVIDKHLPAGQQIDLLNIDTEGFEIEVLSSVDWTKNRPLVIVIEQNNIRNLNDVIHSETCKFLMNKNYEPVAKNVITKIVSTIIYVDKESDQGV